MLSKLKETKCRVVGTSEVLRAINGEKVKQVFIARDASRHLVAPLYRLCAERNIPVVEVDSMRDLGLACGIRVSAAAAALVK